MAWLNGTLLTDLRIAARHRGRRFTAAQISAGYRDGWVMDCECGFPMVAGIDHTCDPWARDKRKV
jgi:hypothetical protein